MRQRSELPGKRQADLDDERRAMSNPCGLLRGPARSTPLADRKPARPEQAPLSGRHATARSSRRCRRGCHRRAYPALAGLKTRDSERSRHCAARCLGDGRRRPDVLSGAHRQRGLSAHRDRAALRPRARAPGRLRAAPGRRGQHLSRLLAREGFGAGRDSARRAGQQRSGAGRADAVLRDRRAADGARRMERHQAALDGAADRIRHRRAGEGRDLSQRHGDQSRAE